MLISTILEKIKSLDKKKTNNITQEVKKPKIGITGSLGRGNYGDELYIKNYQHWFGEWADLYLLTALPRANYLEKFAQAYVDILDAVVLGGGDLLCPYREKIDQDFINHHYLRKPTYVSGIGVERNKPDINPDVLKKWAKFLSHKNIRAISTRDVGSKDWISKHINPPASLQSHPDLVLALPLPKATKPKGAPILGITTRHIKSEAEYILLKEIVQSYLNKGWKVNHIIGGVGPHGVKDFENSKLVNVEGKETFYTENLDDISQAIGECSLLLSMKLHTTIVSVMYGVPTVCINPVAKAKAFMETVGLDDLVFNPNDRALLEILELGVRKPSFDKVTKQKKLAENFMEQLSLKLWEEFLNNHPEQSDINKNIPQYTNH